MGERKVLNKYFPPDFDPEELPKRKRPKDGQIKVRVMLPFTCQCHTCGEFIYRGRKFTSRQEFAPEKYLTITIFRFYIKCPSCCAEITFKTDPEHADYICEFGATRHFEPYKQDDARLEFFKKTEDRETPDPMKALENRTKASKREMDLLDTLEEIKDMNARTEKLGSVADMMALIPDQVAIKQRQEDDAEIQQIFGANTVKRLEEEEEDSELMVKTKKKNKTTAETSTSQEENTTTTTEDVSSPSSTATPSPSPPPSSLFPHLLVNVKTKKKKKKKDKKDKKRKLENGEGNGRKKAKKEKKKKKSKSEGEDSGCEQQQQNGIVNKEKA